MIERDELREKVMVALHKLRHHPDKKKRVSTEEISHRIQMSYNAVKNWEKGRSVPKVPAIERIEDIFGIRIIHRPSDDL